MKTLDILFAGDLKNTAAQEADLQIFMLYIFPWTRATTHMSTSWGTDENHL